MQTRFQIFAHRARAWVFLCAFCFGCRGQPDLELDVIESGGAAEPELNQPAASTSASGGIRHARDLLKAGQVDDAAARLAQMQVRRVVFDESEARQYRQAYAEAYDRALEAIQRGDPRGEIALRLLRAAAPR
jgi:hypothetical protein